MERDQVVAFGMYTVSKNILKMSAQLYPLYPDETREVRLEVLEDDTWQEIGREKVNDLGWSALFRIENWDNSRDVAYRLRHGKMAIYEGLIRRDPADKEEIVLAAFTGNSNRDRGSREHYIRNVNALDPDILFFFGRPVIRPQRAYCSMAAFWFPVPGDLPDQALYLNSRRS